MALHLDQLVTCLPEKYLPNSEALTFSLYKAHALQKMCRKTLLHPFSKYLLCTYYVSVLCQMLTV